MRDVSRLRAFLVVLGESPLTIATMVVIAIYLLIAAIGPFIVPQDPLAQSFLHAGKPPSADHWFGTDRYGRDTFSRVEASAINRFGEIAGTGSIGGTLHAVLLVPFEDRRPPDLSSPAVSTNAVPPAGGDVTLSVTAADAGVLASGVASVTAQVTREPDRAGRHVDVDGLGGSPVEGRGIEAHARRHRSALGQPGKRHRERGAEASRPLEREQAAVRPEQIDRALEDGMDLCAPPRRPLHPLAREAPDSSHKQGARC